MQYEIINSNNYMSLEISNYTWVEVKLGSKTIFKMRSSDTSNQPITINNLKLGVYDITSDGVIDNTSQSYRTPVPQETFSLLVEVNKEGKPKKWYTIKAFIFKGTDILGDPTACELVGGVQSNGGGSVRIYDITNNKTIITIDVDGIRPDTFQSSNFQNLPSTEAIFEVQYKTNVLNKKIVVDSILLQF